MVKATNSEESRYYYLWKKAKCKKGKTHPSLKEQEKEIGVISYFGDKGAKLEKQGAEKKGKKKSFRFMNGILLP